jgi:hypothetical protein
MDACVRGPGLSVTVLLLRRRTTRGLGESPVHYLTSQFVDVLEVGCHPQEDHHVRADVSGQE